MRKFLFQMECLMTWKLIFRLFSSIAIHSSQSSNSRLFRQTETCHRKDEIILIYQETFKRHFKHLNLLEFSGNKI